MMLTSIVLLEELRQPLGLGVAVFLGKLVEEFPVALQGLPGITKRNRPSRGCESRTSGIELWLSGGDFETDSLCPPTPS